MHVKTVAAEAESNTRAHSSKKAMIWCQYGFDRSDKKKWKWDDKNLLLLRLLLVVIVVVEVLLLLLLLKEKKKHTRILFSTNVFLNLSLSHSNVFSKPVSAISYLRTPVRNIWVFSLKDPGSQLRRKSTFFTPPSTFDISNLWIFKVSKFCLLLSNWFAWIVALRKSS